MKLLDKVAIVTGSGRGIGRVIALTFAREGAYVVVNALHSETVESTVREIASMGRSCLSIVADVSKEDEVSYMVARAIDRYGKIDILVNNAGTDGVKPTLDLERKEWGRVLDVNLTSVFLCSKEVAKYMKKQGGGRIINISSICGRVAFPQRAAYCSSKAGVEMLTRVLAIEWAKYGISVNAIAPGYVLTDGVKDLIKRGLFNQENITQRTPMARFGEPDEIAAAAVFLAGQESSFITGETIVVDGGWTAYGYL